MERVEELKSAVEPTDRAASNPDKETSRLLHMVHKTIKKVTEDLKRFHLNTAIAATMELVNGINRIPGIRERDEEALRVFRGAIDHLIILVSPFCPHITQELWEALGHEPPDKPSPGLPFTKHTRRRTW